MMAIKNRDDLAAFLQNNECETTIDELETFYQNAIGETGEGVVSDESVEAVAGGCGIFEQEHVDIKDIIQLKERLMAPGVLESIVKIKIPDDDV